MRRLLLVDDDPALLTSCRGLLASGPLADVDVRCVAAPGDAAEAMAAQGFSLILSDHNLRTDRTGVDVLREAARLQPGARRILVSGEDPESLRAFVDGVTVHGYIEKGVRPDAFMDRVEKELSAGPTDVMQLPRVRCIACRHAFFAEGILALTCPACGSREIRGADAPTSLSALRAPRDTVGHG